MQIIEKGQKRIESDRIRVRFHHLDVAAFRHMPVEQLHIFIRSPKVFLINGNSRRQIQNSSCVRFPFRRRQLVLY